MVSKRGAHVPQDQDTVLNISATNKSLELVKLLLAQGADVAAKGKASSAGSTLARMLVRGSVPLFLLQSPEESLKALLGLVLPHPLD